MAKLRHTDLELRTKHQAIWDDLSSSWKQFWLRKIRINSVKVSDLFVQLEQELLQNGPSKAEQSRAEQSKVERSSPPAPKNQSEWIRYARFYKQFLDSYPGLDELGRNERIYYYLTNSMGKIYLMDQAEIVQVNETSSKSFQPQSFQPPWKDLSQLKSVDTLLLLGPDALPKNLGQLNQANNTLEYSTHLGIAPDTRNAVLTFLFSNDAMDAMNTTGAAQGLRFAVSIEVGKIFNLAKGFFQSFEWQLNYLDNTQLKTSLLTLDEDDSKSFFFKTYGKKVLLDEYGLSSGLLSTNRNVIYEDMAEVLLKMMEPIDLYKQAEPSMNLLLRASNKEQRGKRLDLELQIRGYMEPLIVSNISSSLEEDSNYSAQIVSIGKIYMLPPAKNIVFIDSIVQDSWWDASEFINTGFRQKLISISLLFFAISLLILLPLIVYSVFMRQYAKDFFHISSYIGKIPVVDKLVEKEENREAIQKLTVYNQELQPNSRASEQVVYDLQHCLVHLVKAVDYWREQSSIDELTGLLNRKGLNQVCGHEFSRMKRSGSPFSLVLLDIDRFKQVNDQYGHEVGDLVLKSLTKSLASTFRISDYIGRWGGEEFLIVLPDTSLNGAIQVAEEVRSSVENIIIQTQEATLKLTISVGVATSMGDTTFNDILKFSDQSLYKAKENGRNQTWAYDQVNGFFPVQAMQRERKTLV